MVSLVGVITVVVALVDSLVAQHADLVVVFTGSLADPLAVVEFVDGRCQVFLGNSGSIT